MHKRKKSRIILNALELARINKTSKAMNITDLRKVIVPDDSPNNIGWKKNYVCW